MSNMIIKKVALFAVGGSGWQGGIQYITNLIAGFNRLAQIQNCPIQILLLKNENQHFNLNTFVYLDIKLVDINKDIPKVWLLKRVANYINYKLFRLNYNTRIISFLQKEKIDFVYPLALPKTVALNSAGWVADFQHRNFPNCISAEFTKQAEKWVFDELAHSNKVVLSSEFCKSDCAKFYPQFLNKTIVMPFLVHISETFLTNENLKHTKEKYQINKPFFLISNLFCYTKNHSVVFNALHLLKQRGIEIQVFCTGNIVDSRNTSFANKVLNDLTKYQIRNQVQILGLIPRVEQINLYRLSLAMIQPSLSEGWSTCVEEAKVLGKNMLLSDIGVHREQWPDNKWFFNPNRAEELADKIDRLYKLNELNNFPNSQQEQVAFKAYNEHLDDFAKNILDVIVFEPKV